MTKNERIEALGAIEGQNPLARWEKFEKLYALVEGDSQTPHIGNLGGFKVKLIDPSIFNLVDPSHSDQLSAIRSLNIIGGRLINDAGTTKYHFRADFADRLRDQKKFVIVNDKGEDSNEEVCVNADDIETFEPPLQETPKAQSDEMGAEELSSRESTTTGNSFRKSSAELPLFQRIKQCAKAVVSSIVDIMTKDFVKSNERRAEDLKKEAKRERERNLKDDIKTETRKKETLQRAHNIEAINEVEIDSAIKKGKTPPPRKKN